MKKLLILLLALPALVFAQSYPTPVFNALTITGGSLNAGTAVFTGQVSLGGSAGAEALRAVTTSSAVNWLQVQGNTAGNAPILSVQGSDANASLGLYSKGSGSFYFGTGGGARTQAVITDTANSVNWLQLTGAPTNNGVTISAQGNDTNVNLNANAKGTGAIVMNTGGGTQAVVSSTASANRYLTFTGSNGGNPTIGASAGRVAITPGLDASPIGAVTPSTGAFTTLAASSTVSGSGFDNYITSANTRGLIDSMTNAKAYGALGNSNGTHGNGNDDTTALQNALNASANGILHIPCGTYRITASLQESSTNNYWIQGDGQCTKIYNDAATAVPTFRFNPSTYNGNTNPTIKITGINFITPNVTGGGQTAVTFQNESAPQFTGNIVQGYQVGLSFTTTYGPVIDHNSFYSMKGAAIDCSIDASCNNAQILQNGFFSNGITNSDAAIKMSSPTNINGFSVIGNDIEGNYGGIIASNVSGGVIAGNYIENQTGYNLWFASGNSSIDINGNWLGASPTLTLQGLSNSVFQNNAIYNYTIGQGTTTSVRQINNTTTGTGSITLPSIGQLNSNTTSGTSMTTNTPVNCTSINLPPGTWDVQGTVQFAPASTTVVNYMHASISLTSATMGSQPYRTDVGGISATGSNVGSMSQSTPIVRETFASTTTVYLIGNSQFTTSTQTCNGYIRATLVQ